MKEKDREKKGITTPGIITLIQLYLQLLERKSLTIYNIKNYPLVNESWPWYLH